MPADEFNRQVDELSSRYEKTAAYLGTAIAALAAAEALKPSALQAARTAIQTALSGLLAASVAWVGQYIPLIYLRGMAEAQRSIGPGVSQEELRRQLRTGAHREAVTTLAETLRDDLAAAVENLGRDSNRALSEIRRRNVQRSLARGAPLSQREQFAAEMEERGIAFVDRSGRRWDAGKYAETVLLTHVASVLNAGHLNKALELGSPGVRVSDGGPGTVDEPCRRANGQHWGLVYAARHLLEHPRCRRSFAPLPRTWKGELDRA